MNHHIIILLLFFSLNAFGQKPIELKGKYLGNYSGNVSAFQMDTGKDVMEVDSTTIQVQISEKQVVITIGRQQIRGTYHVLFEGKKYFVLDCIMEGQLAGERIVVYKKGKKISRDGLYPQPSSFLYKTKD